MKTISKAASQALYDRLQTHSGIATSRSTDTHDDLPTLSNEERLEVVDTVKRMLEGMYAHLPQKRAMYGQDPVQRLRLLHQHVKNTAHASTISDAEFHRRMAEILTDMRDSHTRYIVGASNRLLVDMLPLLVEYFEEPSGESGFVASKVRPLTSAEASRFDDCGFVDGVQLTHWNAVPIKRAVELYAANETGGRPEAQRARALESLTLRPKYFALRPDAEWVNISFTTLAGESAEIRVDWQCIRMDTLEEFDSDRPADFARALNPSAESARRVKKMLFATEHWFQEQLEPQPRQTTRARSAEGAIKFDGEWWSGKFARNVMAKLHSVDGSTFGYLRIWSFDLVDDDGFIDEVRALLAYLPSNGLIIDLRANPGGLIWAAERLLQLFTPNSITPTRFSMLATDVTRTMASAPQNTWRLEAWRRSLEASVTNGDPYSGAVPMTAPERCNNIGQHYAGPVVCVVDANTYSAGDLFAAGFIDNSIGPLVCVDGGTGAGGANVWSENEVLATLSGTSILLKALPKNISYTVAIRRATRSGSVNGMGIEDVGVTGNFNHALTRRDLTEGNKDLLNFCSRLLLGYPRTDMQVKVTGHSLAIECNGIDRVDVYERDRPVASEFISKDSPDRIAIELATLPAELEVVGFAGDIVRQRRRLLLNEFGA